MQGLVARYARWRYERERSVEWQRSQLKTLQRCIAASQSTTFAKDHGLTPKLAVTAYQEQVPLRTYEELYDAYTREAAPHYEGVVTGREVRFLTTSSGTTSGLLKEFPVTWEGIRGSRNAAAHQAFATITKLGHMRPFQRAYLSIADLTPLQDVGGGLMRGAITRILSETTPAIVKRRAVVPECIAESGASDVLDAMIEAALGADLGMLTGMTHWLLEFVERAKVRSGKASMREIWPNLQVVCHGGVPYSVYREPLEAAFQGGETPFILAESYGASEGVLALGDPMLGGALRLCSQNDIFYEFVPISELGTQKPTRLGVHEVRADEPYAVVVTTPSGLWSHLVGDMVVFLDAELKTLEVRGRLSGSLELWNEHTTETDVDSAFERIRRELGLEARFYHLGPEQYPNDVPRGRYIAVIELEESGGVDAALVARVLDEGLCHINKMYRRLREDGGPLDQPLVHLVDKGFFDTWLDERPGGSFQRKVPRVDGSQRVVQELLAMRQR